MYDVLFIYSEPPKDARNCRRYLTLYGLCLPYSFTPTLKFYS